jgi:hypothetical protein
MITKLTTAADMAHAIGIEPDLFRNALRSAGYPRKRNTDWGVAVGSSAHSEMRTILVSLLRRKAA